MTTPFTQWLGQGGAKPVPTPGAAGPPSSSFGDWLTGDQQNARDTVASRLAQPVNPDTRAEATRFSLRTGLPVDIVERNLDQVRQAVSQADFDPEKFRTTNPVVARWLAEDIENAKVAQDDLEPLGLIERLLGRWEVNTKGYGRSELPVLSFRQTAPGRLQRSYHRGTMINERGEIGMRLLMGEESPELRARAKELTLALAEPQPEAEGFFERMARSAAEILPSIAYSATQGLAGAGGGAVAGASAAALAGQAGPQVAVPEEVITVPAAAASGAVVGSVASAFRASASLEGGNAYLDMLEVTDRAGNPMDPTVARAASFAVAIASGTLETVGLGAITQPFRRAAAQTARRGVAQALARPTVRQAFIRGIKDYGKAVGTEVTTEVAQQGVQLFAEQLGRQASNDRGSAFDSIGSERVWTELSETAMQTLMGMALLGIPGGSVTTIGGLLDAADATERQSMILALGENAAASKLRERLPEKFEELVTRIREQGPVTDVGIPIERFNLYFQSQGMDPAAIAREVLSDPSRYEEAVASGTGDLVIPLEEYASRLAATAHHKGLAADIRLRPTDLTAREAREAEANSDAEFTALQQEARELETGGPAGTEREDTSMRVYDDLKEKLVRSGVYTEEQADSYARFNQRVFRTLARRRGREAWDLYTEQVGDVLGPEAAKEFLATTEGGEGTVVRQPPPKRLSALHNIGTHELRAALKLGGLPAPSIAVVREGDSFPSFGSVTLIGGAAMVDPATTPVFDADVWSGTFPRIEHKKVPYKKAQAFIEEFSEYATAYGDERFEPALWHAIVQAKSASDTQYTLIKSNAAKARWLKEVKGITVAPVRGPAPASTELMHTGPMREFHRTTPVEINAGVESEYGLALASAVSRAIDETTQDPEMAHLAGFLLSEYMHPERSAFGRPVLKLGRLDRLNRDLLKMGTEVILEEATNRALGAAINAEERGVAKFHDWARAQVDALFGQPFVKVGRRLEPMTLATLTDAMTRSRRIRNKEEGMTFGEGSARAQVAKRFRSMAQMRRTAETRLKDADTVEEQRDRAKEALSDWRNEVIKFRRTPGVSSFGEIWEGLDASMRAIARWAMREYRTPTESHNALAAALTGEGFRDVPPEVITQGIEAGALWRESPSPYFEAKPQRAVTIDEFAGAVVPADTDPDVLLALQKSGLKVRTYTSELLNGSDAPRDIAVQELRAELAGTTRPDVLFQRGVITKTPEGWLAGPTNPDLPVEAVAPTVLIQEGVRRLGASGRLRGSDDVARAFSYLGDLAAERFDAIVTDADGRPLAVLGNTKGGLTSTMVHAPQIVAEAVRIPGAARIYVGHNHPSGVPTPSPDDKAIDIELAGMIHGSGIVFGGSYVIGARAGARYPYIQFGNGVMDHEGSVVPVARGKRVPIVERIYAERPAERTKIGGPTDAGRLAKQVANGRSGAMMLDSQRRYVGFLPVDFEALPKIRGTPLQAALYRAVSVANPHAVVLLREESTATEVSSVEQRGIRNLSGLLTSLDVPVLDVLDLSAGEYRSWAERGHDIPSSRTFYQRDRVLNFHSALERAVDGAKVTKQPVGQWRSWLKANAGKLGIKQGEIEWLMIPEFFDILGDERSLTKEEFADFVRRQGIEVRQITLDDTEDSIDESRLDDAVDREISERVDDRTERFFDNHSSPWFYVEDKNDEGEEIWVVRHEHDSHFEEVFESEGEAQGREEELADEWGDEMRADIRRDVEDDESNIRDSLIEGGDFSRSAEAQFEQYTLEGGEEYAEHLLVSQGRRARLRRPTYEVENHGTAIDPMWVVVDANGNFISRHGADEAAARKRADPNFVMQDMTSAFTAFFNDHHFSDQVDEDALFVHFRTNRRQVARPADLPVGTEFKSDQILFIEEIQSDWAQRGRRRGFITQQMAAIQQELRSAQNAEFTRKIQASFREFSIQRQNAAIDGTAPRDYDVHAEWAATEEAQALQWGDQALGNLIPQDGVSTGPFVEKTEEWTALAIKAAMRTAIRRGATVVAWTTGRQQNDRYDLAKYVDRITWVPDTRRLEGFKDVPGVYGGKEIFSKQLNDNEDLADYVGKGLADHLESQASEHKFIPGIHLATGTDLAIGAKRLDEFYDRIVPSVASKLIKKWGGKIEEFETFLTGKQPGFRITEQMLALAESDIPLFQRPEERAKDPRGFASLGPNPATIGLLERANLSTFIHEMGHVYLETLGDAAAADGADASLVRDYETVLKWLGVEDRAGIDERAHEQWARGIERYLAEGKSPVPELVALFARFRAWLTSLYRDLRGLDVDLTPEVIDVMDRLVATEEEIAAARMAVTGAPLFDTAEAMGASTAEFENYRRMTHATAAREAEDLQQQVLAERAKESQTFWRAKRAEVRDVVEAAVNSDPIQQARHFLRTGERLDGQPLPENVAAMRIDRTILTDRYGPDITKSLPIGVTTKKGGVDPDVIANLFGIATGDELVAGLQRVPNRKQEVERLTEERMKAEFGDILGDSATLAQAAQDAVHGNPRGEQYLAELRVLGRSTGMRAPTDLETVAQVARETIEKKKVGDIHPFRYQQAEMKAGRLAFEALDAEDRPKAWRHKRQQLLNNLLYREARRAVLGTEKIVAYMARTASDAARARLGKAGADYLEQVDGILERYSFRKISSPALERKEGLREWIERQEANGRSVTIPKAVQDEARRLSYREVPYTELVGIYDTVRQIQHLARTKNKLLAGRDTKEFEERVADVVGAIEANHKVTPEPVDFAKTPFSKYVKAAKTFEAKHVRPEFLFRWLDGDQVTGTVWKALFRPIADAENTENLMLAELSQHLQAIFAQVPEAERKKWLTQKTFVPAANAYFTKSTVIALALNRGNAGNLEAVQRGYNWTPQTIDAILRSQMSRADWEMVQNLWNLIDGYWPEIERIQRELTGLVPEKVERVPFTIDTKDGTSVELEGGYYPLKYDSELSFLAFKREERENVKDLFGSNFIKPATKHGHTEERVGSAGQAVKLEISVLTDHLTNVVHDLSHRRAIIDVDRTLQDPRVRAAIEGTAGKASYRLLRPWLQQIANDRRDPAGGLEAILAHARVGATVVNMGWKATTAITQVLGFTQTLEVLGGRYTGRGVAAFFGTPAQMKRTVDLVLEKSVAMRNRRTSFDRDVRDLVKQVGTADKLSGVQQSFFYATGMMDMAVAVPTWYGAYLKSIEVLAPGNEEAAVDYADSIVRLAQGSGSAKDLADIQRGSEYHRIFTMFYSYFSVMYNLMRRSGGLALERGVTDVPRFAASMMLLWILPSVLGELIVGRGPDDGEDELKWAARRIATYPFQAVVLLRDVVNGMGDYDFELSPVAEAFRVVSRVGRKAIEGQLFDPDRTDIRDAVTAAGYWAHLPARQMWITGEYLTRWITGSVSPETPQEAVGGVLFAPPR